MKRKPASSRWIGVSLSVIFLAVPTLILTPADEGRSFRENGRTSAGAAERAGVTYYVDSKAGDDGNAGTSAEKAWQSLEKVNATTFLPGDAILLKNGAMWEGQLWPKGSGTEGRPIRVGMYGGGVKPLIRGKGAVEDAVLLKNQEYWEIADLEVINDESTVQPRRGVHLAVENFGEAHHLVVRRMTVHDVKGRDETKDNGGIIYTSEGEKKPSGSWTC